jgi:hypothetical protein
MERFRPPSPSRFSRVAPAVGLLATCGAAATLAYVIAAAGGAGPGGPSTGGTGGQVQVHDFPDAHDEPVQAWTGPVFRLSQSYPTALPPLGPAPWRAFDFRTQTNQYLKAVLAYALEGNTEVDFRGEDNSVRKWYHAPWLHAGDKGREFIHGLTHERRSRAKELAPTQTATADNWAVGMYNPRGGFVLGQVWKNRDNPDPREARFPNGTVGFKLLFTSAPVNQVPFLRKAFTWEVDVNRKRGAQRPPKLRLLQIDVAVRDSRADSTTGWVFGTFIYNGRAPGDTVWERMVPVGAMWGNDPDRLADGGPLVETLINPDAVTLVQHLGYKGRLNGPIDNPKSSCLSCHSTAEIPKDLSSQSTPGIPPNTTPAVLARYFRNIRAQTPFTAGAFSVDYSLQLQNGIANWARETGVRFPAPRDAFGPQRRVIRPSDVVRIAPVSRD